MAVRFGEVVVRGGGERRKRGKGLELVKMKGKKIEKVRSDL